MSQQQHGQQQMTQQQQHRQSSRKARSNISSPDTISVIINGWPNEQASNVAQACAKRGFQVVPFGLATTPSTQQQEVHGKPLRTVPFGDQSAKQELSNVIQQERSNGKFVVIVDCCADETAKEHVQMYNELQVPFVLESSNQQVVRDTEAARTMAMITDQMNKRMSVMDQMWRDWSRRFPGLFSDFDLSFRSSRPRDTPRSLLDSFSDLMDREFGFDDIMPLQQQSQQPQQQSAEVPQPPPEQQQQQQQPQQKQPMLEGHFTREYTFKNGGTGSSTYTFSQTVNDAQEFAESVADSVGFLAQKSQEMARPQVYSILDVAAQPTRYLAL
jgi:4-hydroxy-tetrahydrodipicolinate reductase